MRKINRIFILWRPVFKKIFLKKVVFVFFLAVSPGFWWPMLQPGKMVAEYSRSKLYFNEKVSSLFSEERLMKIDKMRWVTAEQSVFAMMFSKFLYNKLSIFTDEFFSYISFFSPRYYFQSGDGGNFSPPGVEPIPVILFPVWILGLLTLVRKKNTKVFFLLSIFVLLAFIFGQRNLAFLWPSLIFFIYISQIGFLNIKSEFIKTSFLMLVAFYGFYLLMRSCHLSSTIC